MNKMFLIVMGALCAMAAEAQKISYIVSFPNIVHHEATISLTVNNIQQRNAIFRMSRSSPGRYATHEFGKNVYDVKAFDQQGKALTINRIDGDVYEVPRHNGYVRVQYTLYANHPDGTYAGIDETNVHLNMPAAFMWIKGYDNTPIDIKFNIPEGKSWTIATQLKPTADPTLFSAPGLQYFMDSPTKLGDLQWKEWTLKNPNGKSYLIRLALEATGSDSLVTAFANKVKRITEEAQAVYGEVPDYDFGNYTFIASINPWVRGDGMEHRNSTMICLPAQFDGSDYLLGVFSHEFFHCWNVERIRPKTLEPFNFEKSNMSNELWFAEGFTQYYGDLLMKRAGLQPEQEYQGEIAQLINTKENTSGAKRFSPVEMSRHAVFVDAGVAIDKNNYPNMYTSYYPYGGAVALALDLELRTRFQNLTLDNYMAAVWKKFGKPFIPYTVNGLEEVLEQVTNDKAFATGFFNKYVNGHEFFSYQPLLSKAGFSLKKPYAGKAWIGNVQYRETADGLNIASNTVIGTPLYTAGLDIDDQLLQLDGKAVKKQSDLNDILAAHKPGEQVKLEYKHHGQTKNVNITLGENPALLVVLNEEAGINTTGETKQFKDKWLGSQVR